jgi:hypothetical protein
MAGGQVEREVGGVRYGLFMLLMVFVGGLSIWLGTQFLGVPYRLGGPFLMVAPISIVWAVRNPTAQVMLYGIVPVSARVLGFFTAALVILLLGADAPLLGVFACANLAVAFLWASDRIPRFPYRSVPKPYQPSRAQVEYDEKYFDDVKRREREREERERLRKLFEDSLDDDPKDR